MNVLISASSISKSKYSLAVIRKVAVSLTKPLRSASQVVKWCIWRICPSNKNHCLCDVIQTLGCQDEMGTYYARPPFKLHLWWPRPIFEVERPIEKISHSYTTVLVGTPSNAVCVRQMQMIVWVTSYILWVPKEMGSSEPNLRIPTTDFQS